MRIYLRNEGPSYEIYMGKPTKDGLHVLGEDGFRSRGSLSCAIGALMLGRELARGEAAPVGEVPAP